MEKRSFWQYLLDNRPWMTVFGIVSASVIGYISFTEGTYLMSAFMVVVITVLVGGSYVNWKQRG